MYMEANSTCIPKWSRGLSTLGNYPSRKKVGGSSPESEFALRTGHLQSPIHALCLVCV